MTVIVLILYVPTYFGDYEHTVEGLHSLKRLALSKLRASEASTAGYL